MKKVGIVLAIIAGIFIIIGMGDFSSGKSDTNRHDYITVYNQDHHKIKDIKSHNSVALISNTIGDQGSNIKGLFKNAPKHSEPLYYFDVHHKKQTAHVEIFKNNHTSSVKIFFLSGNWKLSDKQYKQLVELAES